MDRYVIHDRIREVILVRPDLRHKGWQPDKKEEYLEFSKTLKMNPYLGFCYVATYAFCHLVKEASPYTIDRTHFWAQIGDEIWDLTKEQFDKPYEYEKGRKLARKSKLTIRVKELLKEANLL